MMGKKVVEKQKQNSLRRKIIKSAGKYYRNNPMDLTNPMSSSKINVFWDVSSFFCIPITEKWYQKSLAKTLQIPSFLLKNAFFPFLAENLQIWPKTQQIPSISSMSVPTFRQNNQLIHQSAENIIKVIVSY